MTNVNTVIDLISIVPSQSKEVSELFDIFRGWHGFYGNQFSTSSDIPV